MKPPTFIECTVCGREFGSKSIVIHERQCLQKLRRTEINQEVQHVASVPVKSIRRRKKVERPIESAMESTFRMEKSPDSPKQPHILFPKINTKNRKSSTRPTTATLSKPKFLNPEYMQHDMTLTRIAYATSQLRLDDDENHNMRSDRQNFVLPAVHPTKPKKPSTGKIGSNERRTTKLPDSMKLCSISDSKKQNGIDSSVSVIFPNPEFSASCHLRLAQKSQSFPVLSLRSPKYSSDFVMKRMKANEKHFPQITNDRSPVQPSSNYYVTRASRRPNWDDDEGRQLPGKCPCHIGHFFGASQEGEIQNSTATDGLELLDEDFDEPVPEVIFLRNSESFGALSQQSFGSLDDNSFETLVNVAISHANAHLHSPEAEISTEDMDLKTAVICEELNSQTSLFNKEFSDPVDKWVASGFLLQNSPKNAITTTVSFALPLIPVYEKKDCANANAWLYTDCNSQVLTPSPKSILKQRAGCEHTRSNVSTKTALPRSGSLRRDGTFSGSDCDNESTSSGYRFLRAVSSRSMLKSKKERQRCMLTTRSAFKGAVESTSLPSSLYALQDTMDFLGEGALVNDSNHLTYSTVDSDNLHKKCLHPSSKSMIQSHEKVKNWLLGCAKTTKILNNAPTTPVLEGNEVKSFTNKWMRQKSNEPNVCHRSDEKIYSTDVDLSFKEESERQSSEKVNDKKENYGKIISGLVSAIFKVKELDETRTYKFVNKMVTKGIGKISSRALPTTPPASRLEAKDSKTLNRPITFNAAAFQCYAPPKCLKSNKRVVKMLKELEASTPLSTSTKRPTTAPLDVTISSLDPIQSSQMVKRPKTVEPQQQSHKKTEVSKRSSIQNKFNLVFNKNSKPQHSCHFASKAPNPRPKTTPLSKLVFGPQQPSSSILKHTTSKTNSSSNYTTGMRRLNLKFRPVTPRPPSASAPQTKLGLKNCAQPRNDVKCKMNKSSQIPETRSMYVQYSPELLNKTRAPVTMHQKVSGLAKTKVTFPSNEIKEAETKAKIPHCFQSTEHHKVFNTSTNILERKGSNSTHLNHLIYQFHSTLKDLSSRGDLKYSSDLQDDRQERNEDFDIHHDNDLHTTTIQSTYTLLIPKSPDSNQTMDLKVVIRRRTIGDPNPNVTSGECSPSSMYLIIDEVRETTSLAEYAHGEIGDWTHPNNLTPQIKKHLRQVPDEDLCRMTTTCCEGESQNLNLPQSQTGQIQPTKSFRVNLSPSFFHFS